MARVLRRVGIVLAGLVSLALLVAIGLYAAGTRRLDRQYVLAEEALAIPSDTMAIARGRHLATAVTICTACHGNDLSGNVIEDVPNVVTLAASNLTRGRGGVGNRYADADFARVIRHGVKQDGRGVLIMHSDRYHNLSRDDLAAIIAWVKSVPPVDHEVATVTHPLGRIMVALGLFDSEGLPLIAAEHIDHDAPFRDRPRAGPTADYGAYLLAIGVCIMCHGDDFRGAPPIDPTSPAAPDVTHRVAPGGWTAAAFAATIRTGTTPDGRVLNPDWMPWPTFSRMTDEELIAIWLRIEELARAG